MGQERLADEFDVVGELAFKEVPKTRSQLYRMALDARPDLRAAEAARQKARADINLAKAMHGGTLRRRSSTSASAPTTPSASASEQSLPTASYQDHPPK